ncbi:MAG: hypothetical protein AAFU41_13515 [Pseudomonadota bacterium]
MPTLLKPLIIPALMLLSLGACGSSGSGGDAAADFSDIRGVAQANFAPVFDDGIAMIEAAAQTDDPDGGIDTIVGLQTGELAVANVRVSEDRDTAFLSINGEAPIAYNFESESNRGFRTFINGDERLRLKFGTRRLDLLFTADDGFNAQGFLSTPVEQLPTGAVAYGGQWFAAPSRTAAAFASARGSFAMEVDFDTGATDGVFTGTAEAGPSTGINGFFGVIEGNTEDGIFAGTAQSQSGSIPVNLDMLGTFTDNGSQIIGGVAGTVNSIPVGGTFSGSETGF